MSSNSISIRTRGGALSLLVLGLAAVAVWATGQGGAVSAAGGAASASGQRGAESAASGAIAVPEQATPGPTATLEYVEPSGNWSALHAPRTDPLWTRDASALRGVHGVWDGDTWIGWAVGDEGALARFDGTRWQVLNDFDPSRTQPITYWFRDVYVAAPDDVWVVGMSEGDRFCDGCGMILHYDGKEWTELDRYSFGVNGRVAAFNAIDMLQDDDGDWYGWIVGDDADFDRFKAAIIGLTPEDGWRIWPSHNIAKNLYDVKLVSPVEAWTVGQDGVESWYNERSGQGIWPPLGRSGADTLYAVDLNDPLDGWDGGFRGRMNKYRGHCHDDDTGTQCWFQNEAIPIRGVSGSLWAITLYGIDLLSRNEGWLVGAQSGRESTVAYLKEAKRWQVVEVVNDPGKDLYALHMISSAWGLAVGDEGTIVEYRGVEIPTAVPTVTASATPTASRTSTATATATRTAPASATGESTATPTGGASGTVWPPATTAVPTGTVTGEMTPTGTQDASATATPTLSTTGSPPTPPHAIFLPLTSRSW